MIIASYLSGFQRRYRAERQAGLIRYFSFSPNTVTRYQRLSSEENTWSFAASFDLSGPGGIPGPQIRVALNDIAFIHDRVPGKKTSLSLHLNPNDPDRIRRMHFHMRPGSSQACQLSSFPTMTRGFRCRLPRFHRRSSVVKPQENPLSHPNAILVDLRCGHARFRANNASSRPSPSNPSRSPSRIGNPRLVNVHSRFPKKRFPPPSALPAIGPASTARNQSGE